MSCRRTRRLLQLHPGRREVRDHLALCPACTGFAARLAEVERALAAHRATELPPAGFSRRIAARLPPPEDLVGWAALRLLPATLALVLLLSWLNQRTQEATPASDPADVLSSWVLDPFSETGGGS